ncbi:hypothetical protein VO63_16740 [Streptomyces showdoensis]|uniref:Uncharacterized protein n=1 Tax=Streptomyces showdoensis TaxID=68268 RepID=A0A2P2GMN8_STREW|nr:hypothetical protein VO63_16740 [Streptomyces showdoensis]
MFVCAAGLVLLALLERVQGFRSGRQYVLCHAAPVLDHRTLLALALVAAAFLAGVVGAAAAALRGRPVRPGLLVLCMVAALAFVVAADRVDDGGERRAAELAAGPFDEKSCDYAPQVYSATPGWFSLGT